MAERFYVKQKVLLEIPTARGEVIRLTEGHKDNGKVYLDLRTWYRDEDDTLKPGKGFAKPVETGWDQIGHAIVNRNECSQVYDTGKIRVFNPKTGEVTTRDIEADD
jgi:hypothetical protein